MVEIESLVARLIIVDSCIARKMNKNGEKSNYERVKKTNCQSENSTLNFPRGKNMTECRSTLLDL